MIRTAFFLLALGASPAAALERAVAVDGDTVRVGGRLVRVVGLDAPEMRARCPREARLARAATRRMAELVADGVELAPLARKDKYGRLLAHVFDADRHDVALVLIAEGLARPYDGRTKRRGWCGGP